MKMTRVVNMCHWNVSHLHVFSSATYFKMRYYLIFFSHTLSSYLTHYVPSHVMVTPSACYRIAYVFWICSRVDPYDIKVLCSAHGRFNKSPRLKIFLFLNTTHETKLQRHYLLFKECFSIFHFFLVWKGRIPWWLVRSLGLLQHSAGWPACLPLTSYNIGSADFGKHYTADFRAWSVDPIFLLHGQWP